MSMKRPSQPMTCGSLDDVQVLRQQLDNAQETIQRYTDIIISQANELTMYRNTMCQTCRPRYSPPFLSSSEVGVMTSSGQRRRRSSSPSDIPDRRVRRRQALPTTVALSPPSPLSDANSPLPLNFPSAISTLLKVIPAACGTEMSTWSVRQDTKAARPLDITFVHSYKHDVGVLSVCFSPDGKHLAVGLARLPNFTDSGKVVIYEVRSGDEHCILRACLSTPPQPYTGAVFSMSFAPNGKFLATGHSDGQIRLFDLSRKLIRAVFKCIGTVWCVDFSSNGRLLASISAQGVHIWNVKDGSCKMLLRPALVSSSHCIRFSPNGRYLATGDPEGNLRIWDARTGWQLEKWSGHGERLYSVAFTPNGKELLSSSADKTVKCWDIGSLEVPATRSPSEQAVTRKNVTMFQGHADDVCSLEVSPDGLWALSGSEDETARIWNTRDTSQNCTLLGHRSSIRSVAFSPAGEYLAVGGLDGQVSVWKYRAT